MVFVDMKNMETCVFLQLAQLMCINQFWLQKVLVLMRQTARRKIAKKAQQNDNNGLSGIYTEKEDHYRGIERLLFNESI